MLIEIIYFSLMHILAIPATVFPILYARTDWNTTTIGRALMWFSTSLALLVDVTLLNAWLSIVDYEFGLGSTILGILVLLWAIGGATAMVIELRRSQRKGQI